MLVLTAQALMADLDQRKRIAAPVVAAWLNYQALREALQAARSRGRHEFHYVSSERDLAFWAILKAGRVERPTSGARIVIDLGNVVRLLRGMVRIGLPSDEEVSPPSNAAMLEVPVQALYRAWGLREAELERIRPFFGDDALRAKIKPIEIEIEIEIVGARRDAGNAGRRDQNGVAPQ